MQTTLFPLSTVEQLAVAAAATRLFRNSLSRWIDGYLGFFSFAEKNAATTIRVQISRMKLVCLPTAKAMPSSERKYEMIQRWDRGISVAIGDE